MAYKRIVTGQDLLEKITYPSENFPLCFCEDRFDEYLNGEMNVHWHEDFEFGVIVRGTADCYIRPGAAGGAYRRLRAGDGVFVNSGALHRMVQAQPGTVLLDFLFPLDFFRLLPLGEIHRKNILPILRAPAGLFLSRETAADRPLLDCIEQLCRRNGEEAGYELHCMELVCRLWRELFLRAAGLEQLPAVPRAEQVQDQRLRSMLSFIHTRYGEDLSVDAIAAAAHISRSECFRCFRAVVGKTPSEYLCQYRLSQAALMLVHTNRSIVEICYACGFRSASYFGKLFRENCGMTPREYRSRGGHQMQN